MNSPFGLFIYLFMYLFLLANSSITRWLRTCIQPVQPVEWVRTRTCYSMHKTCSGLHATEASLWEPVASGEMPSRLRLIMVQGLDCNK
jgi:hypothetical protein